MSYILAIDQGTSSCRAIIFDEKANIISKSQKSISQHYSKKGWVEQDPDEILKTQIEVIKDALLQKNISPTEIQAVGITNQRETTILWDKNTAKPIYNAIVWQDRRSDDICKSYKSHESFIQKRTGLLLDPYFSATKVQWILENVSGALEKAKRGEILFGTIDTWLIWNLTSRMLHITDVSNASRTLLFNIHSLTWDEELLELFKIPKQVLPRVCMSSEKIGCINKSFFGGEMPICGVIGDQQAALFGQSCTEYGQIKCTYGTGCFLLMNIGKKPKVASKHLITTVGWSLPGYTHYALEGSIFNGGTILNWLQSELNLIEHIDELEGILKSVEDSAGVYFVSALTGLGAPHWNPQAKGAILGLSAQTKKAHIIKAAIDSIAYQVADLITAFELETNEKVLDIKVDGGLAKSNYLMQMQADLSQRTLIQFSIDEVTSLGAAFMAGIAIGLWDLSKIKKLLKEKSKYFPKKESKLINKMRQRWNKAIEVVNGWS